MTGGGGGYRSLFIAGTAIIGAIGGAIVIYNHFRQNSLTDHSNDTTNVINQDTINRNDLNEHNQEEDNDKDEENKDNRNESDDDNDNELEISTENTVNIRPDENRLIIRSGNMIIAFYGIFLIILVTFVSILLMIFDPTIQSIMSFHLFPALIWLGIGIIIASFIQLTQDNMLHSITSMEPNTILSTKGSEYGSNSSIVPNSSNYNNDNHLNFQNEEPRRNINESNNNTVAGTTNNNNDNNINNDQLVLKKNEKIKEDNKSVLKETANEDKTNQLKEIVVKAEELYKEAKHNEIKSFLMEKLKTYPKEIEILCRLARVCNDLADLSNDKSIKKNLAFEGLEYATSAYSLDNNSAIANKWMGIMTSTSGSYLDTTAKIEGAYKTKKYIERSIKINPNDPTCYNILGQWSLAFATMSWFEKKAAAALFGTLPSATYEDAIQYFSQAEKLAPDFWKKNSYLLAETYYKMNNKIKSIYWLEKANKIPFKTKEDKEIQVQIDLLFKKLT